MKLKSLLTFSIFALALSASATDMICHDLEKMSPTHYSVKITTLADITKNVSYGDKYDSVTKVRVELKQTSGRKVLLSKSFEAIATAEDVAYNISAVKSQGFKFWDYVDEENQAGIVLIDEDGTKIEVNMNCTYW